MDKRIISAACERAMRKDMEWGRDDCCLWPCDIIVEDSGADLAKPLRGKYRSKLGAHRAMKKFSGGGLVETAIKLAMLNGLRPAVFPWTGDLIGVVAGDNGPTLALFWQGKWLGRSQTGCTAIPASFGVIAWEVPTCRR